MKAITPEEWAKVEGTQLLVINALRYQRPHPSHQSVLDVQDAPLPPPSSPTADPLTRTSRTIAPLHRQLPGSPAHTTLLACLPMVSASRSRRGGSRSTRSHPTKSPLSTETLGVSPMPRLGSSSARSSRRSSRPSTSSAPPRVSYSSASTIPSSRWASMPTRPMS